MLDELIPRGMARDLSVGNWLTRVAPAGVALGAGMQGRFRSRFKARTSGPSELRGRTAGEHRRGRGLRPGTGCGACCFRTAFVPEARRRRCRQCCDR